MDRELLTFFLGLKCEIWELSNVRKRSFCLMLLLLLLPPLHHDTSSNDDRQAAAATSHRLLHVVCAYHSINLLILPPQQPSNGNQQQKRLIMWTRKYGKSTKFPENVSSIYRICIDGFSLFFRSNRYHIHYTKPYHFVIVKASRSLRLEYFNINSETRRSRKEIFQKRKSLR